MEIINELLSDNIDYLNALRNAEVLPEKIPSPTDSNFLKFQILLKYTIIVGAFSLLVFIVVIANKEEKKKH